MPRSIDAAISEGTPTGDGGQLLPGQLATSRQSVDTSLPALPTAPPFLLTHHPNDFELATLDGRDVLIPGIRKQPLVGGIQGIRQTKKGLDDTIMRAKLEKEGWIFLPEDPPYRQVLQVQGGDLHLSIWENLVVYPGGAADIVFDRAGETRWRLSLVERGIVAPPREGVIAKLIKRYGRRVERLMDAAQTVPSAAGRVKAAEEMVGRLEDAERPRPLGATPDDVARLATENAKLRAQLEAAKAKISRAKPPEGSKRKTLLEAGAPEGDADTPLVGE